MSDEQFPPGEVRVDHLLVSGGDPDRCPACGSPALPIGYGFPGDEMIDKYKRGELLIGGCFVDRNNPLHGCVNGHRWRTPPTPRSTGRAVK